MTSADRLRERLSVFQESMERQMTPIKKALQRQERETAAFKMAMAAVEGTLHLERFSEPLKQMDKLLEPFRSALDGMSAILTHGQTLEAIKPPKLPIMLQPDFVMPSKENMIRHIIREELDRTRDQKQEGTNDDPVPCGSDGVRRSPGFI